jgi:hypothetical protein
LKSKYFLKGVNVTLVLVVVIACAGLIARCPVRIYPDSKSYIIGAEGIIEGLGFCYKNYDGNIYANTFTPGYSYEIAMITIVTGFTSINSVKLLNLISWMITMTSWLVIYQKILKDGKYVFIALLLMIFSQLWYYPANALSDLPFLAMTSFYLALLIHYFNEQRTWKRYLFISICSLIMVVAVLTRIVAVAFIAGSGIVMAYKLFRRREWEKLPEISFCTIIPLIGIYLWLLQNKDEGYLNILSKGIDRLEIKGSIYQSLSRFPELLKSALLKAINIPESLVLSKWGNVILIILFAILLLICVQIIRKREALTKTVLFEGLVAVISVSLLFYFLIIVFQSHSLGMSRIPSRYVFLLQPFLAVLYVALSQSFQKINIGHKWNLNRLLYYLINLLILIQLTIGVRYTFLYIQSWVQARNETYQGMYNQFTKAGWILDWVKKQDKENIVILTNYDSMLAFLTKSSKIVGIANKRNIAGLTDQKSDVFPKDIYIVWLKNYNPWSLFSASPQYGYDIIREDNDAVLAKLRI